MNTQKLHVEPDGEIFRMAPSGSKVFNWEEIEEIKVFYDTLKLLKQIGSMTAAELDLFIKSPPAWLESMEREKIIVLETAGMRLMALEANYNPADRSADADPTYGGDLAEQIAG